MGLAARRDGNALSVVVKDSYATANGQILLLHHEQQKMMGIWKLCVLSIISMSCISSTVLSLSSSQPQLKLEKQTQSQGHETALNAPPASPVHTLILCRHGNSIWNGGEPGTHETFTGWTGKRF
jgi:hypothetical protein